MKKQTPPQLNDFKKELNQRLDNYLNTKKQTFQNSPLLLEATKNIHNSYKKGKRLRPAFIYFGYLACGGNNKNQILDLAVFVELIHCYFLIHDDIMDQDNIRHGSPAMHILYEQTHKNCYTRGDAKHFGLSMAILAGDIAATMGYDILAQSTIDEHTKNKILTKTNQLIFSTIGGQMLDINLELQQSVTQKDIITVYKNKTAKYTVEDPLHIGAIAAQKDTPEIMSLLSNYAIPLGVAFQIQDDILGLFGDEDKLGKPIGSDIREDKRTLLVWKAFENANEDQKKILTSCLGNQNISQEQVNDFRQVITETNSLEYAKNEAKQLLEQSLNVIQEANLASEGKDFLINIADYLISRDY